MILISTNVTKKYFDIVIITQTQRPQQQKHQHPSSDVCFNLFGRSQCVCVCVSVLRLGLSNLFP